MCWAAGRWPGATSFPRRCRWGAASGIASEREEPRGEPAEGTRRCVNWLPRLRPANTKRQQNTTPHNKQVRIESVVLFNETPECYDFLFEYIHLIPVKHGSTPSRPIALRLQNVIIDIGLLNNVVQ